MFRKAFSHFLRPTTTTALLLLLVFSVVRILLVLHAQRSGSYALVSIVFIAMALLVLFSLDVRGRKQIGLVRPESWSRILQVFLWGGVAAFIMGLAANYNYDLTDQNWFVYIAGTYNVPETMSPSDRWFYFTIFSLIGMSFSPIGEELFYRGLIHELLVPGLGQRNATLADAAAFSVVHLAHFGIYPTDSGWGFHPYAAFLWAGFLMLTCLVFTAARQRTKSIWGAVAAHAGYNITMNAIIFFYILD